MHFILFSLVTAMLVFMFHYERNGTPWSLPGTFISRVLWATSFSIGYAILGGMSYGFYVFISLFVSCFVMSFIPHGFAMNMGNRAVTWDNMPPIKVMTLFGKDIFVPKWWPALWMKHFKDKLSFFWQDALGMLSVGLLSSLVLFVPLFFLGMPALNVLFATMTMLISYPLCYGIGQKVPLSIFGNTPHSAMWGEFLLSIAFACSLVVLLWA